MNVIRDDHIVLALLPPKRKRVLRERKHGFVFPRVRTERFKQSFLNRCIFYEIVLIHCTYGIL